MRSSPYPAPPLWPWRLALLIQYAAIIAAGTWVLISPPLSYDGIGLALTTMWGLMLTLGGGMGLAGIALERYKIELPGLVLALGGVVIYDYLSWQQTLTTSPGSGPRALLLIALAGVLTARVVVLVNTDREARHRIGRAHESAEGEAPG